MRTILATLTLAALAAACGCQSDNDTQGYSSTMNNNSQQTAFTDDEALNANLTNGDGVGGPGMTSDTPAPPKPLARSDRNPLPEQEFVSTVTSAGLFEIQSSRLALQKAQSQKIKDIAQHLIDDHTKANQQLNELAAKKNWTVPAALNPADKIKFDDLAQRTDADFDQQYLTQQITAHQAAIELFKAEADNGTDADLKQWAAQTLPTLQSHLNMIQSKENIASEK
jgi:putative membrane protein